MKSTASEKKNAGKHSACVESESIMIMEFAECSESHHVPYAMPRQTCLYENQMYNFDTYCKRLGPLSCSLARSRCFVFTQWRACAHDDRLKVGISRRTEIHGTSIIS